MKASVLRASLCAAVIFACTPMIHAQFACPKGEEVESRPDRPVLTSSAETTQCGVLEVETGFTHTSTAEDKTERSFGYHFRYGLTDRVDLHWEFEPYISAKGFERLHGVGDNWFGARVRLMDESEESWLPAVAVLYKIKAPTANPAKELGSGYVDQQLSLILSRKLGAVNVDVNGVALFSGGKKDTTTTGLGTIAISGPLYKKVRWALESYGGRAGDLHYASQTAALTWRLHPRVVADAFIDVGLTHGADHRRIGFGLTYAIGRLVGESKAPEARGGDVEALHHKR